MSAAHSHFALLKKNLRATGAAYFLMISPRKIVQLRRSFFSRVRLWLLQTMPALCTSGSGRKWLTGREIGAHARFLNIANFPGLDIALQQLFQSPRTLGCAFGTLGAQEFSLVCVLHSKVALHVQCKCDRQEQSTW